MPMQKSAALALEEIHRDVSREFCCSWLHDVEYWLWEVAFENRDPPPVAFYAARMLGLSEEDATRLFSENLRRLAEEAGTWPAYVAGWQGDNISFVGVAHFPLEQWRNHLRTKQPLQVTQAQ